MHVVALQGMLSWFHPETPQHRYIHCKEEQQPVHGLLLALQSPNPYNGHDPHTSRPDILTLECVLGCMKYHVLLGNLIEAR